MSYARKLNRHATHTPQRQAIPGREADMVKNDAGGFNFKTGHWAHLERFLLIGATGGTYYVGEMKHLKRNADCVIKCLAEDGPRVVDAIAKISVERRAASNDPALFALAMAMAPAYADRETRQLAANALPKVARTGSHLLKFVSEVDELRGWGKMLRAAVANWYEARQSGNLGYQLAKYQNRYGWTHRDILRKVHPTGADPEHDAIYRYVTQGARGMTASQQEVGLPPSLLGLELIKGARSEAEVISLIDQLRLTHEMIPNEWKKSPSVWTALLQDMPLNAMVRNLAVMTARGILAPNSQGARHVIEALTNEDAVTKSGLHPMAILKAIRTYGSGKGFRGNLRWNPTSQIVDALDDAFYLSFNGLEPTGKRFVLGIDVSSSMTWNNVADMANLNSATVAAAMAMSTLHAEVFTEVIGFSHTPVKLEIGRRDSLESVMNYIYNRPFGGTDCAIPMMYALDNGIEADVFVVYTDGDTWMGDIHPMQALRVYRDRTGIPAKLVVVNLHAMDHSIADPEDLGTLDVVGFDASFPKFLAQFAKS